MQFEERVDGDSEGRMFRVKSTDPRGPNLTYVCQAEDPETRARSLKKTKTKNKSKVCSSTFRFFLTAVLLRWTGTMAKQLQTQKEFLQALQAPIAYHNKLLKEL